MKITKGIDSIFQDPVNANTESPVYYVFFWEIKNLAEEVGLERDPDSSYTLRTGYKLTKCQNVLEAIKWEKDNSKGRISATCLPVLLDDKDDNPHEVLYLLHGKYPDTPQTDDVFSWTIYREV